MYDPAGSPQDRDDAVTFKTQTLKLIQRKLPRRQQQQQQG